MNLMGAFCDPNFVGWDSTRIQGCKNAVDTISGALNIYWQNVRRECGQWPFYGQRSSNNCEPANAALRANAYYLLPDGATRIYVTSQLTSSMSRLWNNPALKG